MDENKKAEIKKLVENKRESAQEVMNGGENYDGADGARYILELCDACEYLLQESEKK